MAEFPKLSLVIGGVASGKSRFAEDLTRASGLTKTYIATAQAFDDEMAEKIARHRADRGGDWTTVEEPLDLAGAIAGLEHSAVLVDCLSLWLTNNILDGRDIDQISKALEESLAISANPIILVTNEVGNAGVSENALARQFQRDQGRLNQRLAAMADLVVLVTAGLPQVLKGQLPKGLT